jgi:hypothetical protein
MNISPSHFPHRDGFSDRAPLIDIRLFNLPFFLSGRRSVFSLASVSMLCLKMLICCKKTKGNVLRGSLKQSTIYLRSSPRIPLSLDQNGVPVKRQRCDILIRNAQASFWLFPIATYQSQRSENKDHVFHGDPDAQRQEK